MRLNVYIAQNTGISRRAADRAIEEGRITINGRQSVLGQIVNPEDVVALDSRAITPDVKTTTIMLNKPVGYVCSRDGQGSQTVYNLLPKELHHLKLVGRLDKDSSGLILLTNDGQLANQLTHPRYQKIKVYEVRLARPLIADDLQKIQRGVLLEDGLSKLDVQQLEISNQKLNKSELLVPNCYFQITMTEGRNRQIRRTFAVLGYKVIHLRRTTFGNYKLDKLSSGAYINVAGPKTSESKAA